VSLVESAPFASLVTYYFASGAFGGALNGAGGESEIMGGDWLDQDVSSSSSSISSVSSESSSSYVYPTNPTLTNAFPPTGGAPDRSGTYTEAGTYNGLPYYTRDAGGSVLWWDGTNWWCANSLGAYSPWGWVSPYSGGDPHLPSTLISTVGGQPTITVT